MRFDLSAVPGITCRGRPATPLTLAAGERQRRLVDLAVNAAPGTYELTMGAHNAAEGDTVTRKLRVVPAGFPVDGRPRRHCVGRRPGGVRGRRAGVGHGTAASSTHVALYPTPAGNLTAALKRLLQEPCGCFEQTSSTNYPLVMADQYFTTHGVTSTRP